MSASPALTSSHLYSLEVSRVRKLAQRLHRYHEYSGQSGQSRTGIGLIIMATMFSPLKFYRKHMQSSHYASCVWVLRTLRKGSQTVQVVPTALSCLNRIRQNSLELQTKVSHSTGVILHHISYITLYIVLKPFEGDLGLNEPALSMNSIQLSRAGGCASPPRVAEASVDNFEVWSSGSTLSRFLGIDAGCAGFSLLDNPGSSIYTRSGFGRQSFQWVV